MKIAESQKGSTLIELLLYFSLLTVVLILAIDLLIQIGEFSLKSKGVDLVQKDSRFIMDRLAFDLHRASAVNVPANLGDSSNSLTVTVAGETHTYRLLNGNLEYERVKPPPQPENQLANLNTNLTRINSLSFQRVGSSTGKPTIKINFQMEDVKGSKGGPNIKTFETIVGLR